ncbi:hypothetical protein BJH93_13595 [Kocuria polaris]|nr:hypothetical protein [Kocuria polaris]
MCDVTDEQSVGELMRAATSGGDRVRTVVHTTGVSPQMGKPDLIVRINALGTVNIARAFLPLAQEGDSLVNVASYAGHAAPGFLIPARAFPLAETNPARFVRTLVRRAGVVGRKQHSGFAYALSKAYVIWYSERLAAGFGARGARVVSVSPDTSPAPTSWSTAERVPVDGTAEAARSDPPCHLVLSASEHRKAKTGRPLRASTSGRVCPARGITAG